MPTPMPLLSTPFRCLQWRCKLLLVQITNPPRSSGKDVTELHQYVRDIVERVNKRFGSETHQPVYVSKHVLVVQLGVALLSGAKGHRGACQQALWIRDPPACTCECTVLLVQLVLVLLSKI